MCLVFCPVAVVELLCSLERILLLGGLNHAHAIWPESGSYFISFLSSRLGKTMHERIGLICCCNSVRLSFLRRLCTYAMGGHFIVAVHNSFLFLSRLGCSGASFRSSLGALWARLVVRGPLFAAQAVQIRVCVLFHFVVKQADHLLCAGCVHTRHRWSPGAAVACLCCAGCAYPCL